MLCRLFVWVWTWNVIGQPASALKLPYFSTLGKNKWVHSWILWSSFPRGKQLSFSLVGLTGWFSHQLSCHKPCTVKTLCFKLWNILFMAPRIENDSKLKLTVERFAWNDATFRSVTTSWPRYVVTDRNVASFQANRSKLSFHLLSSSLLFTCIKVRNSTCPLARDKWIFRRTTKIANIVVRRTTWIAAGSVTRQRSSYFGVRF